MLPGIFVLAAALFAVLYWFIRSALLKRRLTRIVQEYYALDDDARRLLLEPTEHAAETIRSRLQGRLDRLQTEFAHLQALGKRDDPSDDEAREALQSFMQRNRSEYADLIAQLEELERDPGRVVEQVRASQQGKLQVLRAEWARLAAILKAGGPPVLTIPL